MFLISNQFGGLGALFGGLSPPENPRGDRTVSK